MAVRHSNAIKPLLNKANRAARVAFAMSFVTDIDRGLIHDFLDHVHIDEKQFTITRERNTYYLAPDEKPPQRSCKSKRFIIKIMFLTAIARPQTDPTTGEKFDGKIGIWPFVTYEVAKRKSKNRPAGTLVMKPATVTRQLYRSLLLEKVRMEYCNVMRHG